MQAFYQIRALQIFSSALCLVFSFSKHCLLKNRGFSFDEVTVSSFFFHGSCFQGSYLGSLCLTQGYEEALLYFLLSFIVLSFTFRSMIAFDLISWRGQGPRMFDTLLCQSPGHCGKPRACWQAPSQASMSPQSLLKFTSMPHVCSFGSSKAVVCRQEESHREAKRQALAWCQDPGFESLPCHLQTRGPAFSFSEPQFTHLRKRENFFMKILLSGFWLQCHNVYKRALCIYHTVKMLFQGSCFPLAC